MEAFVWQAGGAAERKKAQETKWAEPTHIPTGQPPAPDDGGRAAAPAVELGPQSTRVWHPGEVVLEHYRVERILGYGGMGAVYLLVRSDATGERFAVKKTRFVREALQRAFLQELQAWLDMPEFPHLVACRFFRTVEGETVIFAEYVEGGSLHPWIQEGRVRSVEAILDVAMQAAWGLHQVMAA